MSSQGGKPPYRGDWWYQEELQNVLKETNKIQSYETAKGKIMDGFHNDQLFKASPLAEMQCMYKTYNIYLTTAYHVR